MKLSRFCSHSLIELNLKSKTKDEVLLELKNLLAKSHSIVDSDVVLDDLIKRENLGSTGVGLGIAFPHTRTKGTMGLCIAFGRSSKGIDFGSIDRKPVHLFFVAVSPEDSHAQHLQVLAKLSLLMRDKSNADIALKANYPEEILNLMDS